MLNGNITAHLMHMLQGGKGKKESIMVEMLVVGCDADRKTNNAKVRIIKQNSSCTKEKDSMASHTITRIGEKERGRDI